MSPDSWVSTLQQTLSEYSWYWLSEGKTWINSKPWWMYASRYNLRLQAESSLHGIYWNKCFHFCLFWAEREAFCCYPWQTGEFSNLLNELCMSEKALYQEFSFSLASKARLCNFWETMAPFGSCMRMGRVYVPEMINNNAPGPSLIQILLLPKPNRMFLLPKPNQVFLLCKPNRVSLLPELYQVFFFYVNLSIFVT